MDELVHSDGAMNVLNQFYEVDKMVYVEGDDDVIFWERVFEKIADFDVEIESVGGKPNLSEYIESITTNNVDYLVAMDSDFDVFLGETEHANIIRTCGYSIENTLVFEKSIFRIVKNISRLPKKKLSEDLCKKWVEDLSSSLKTLTLLSVINEVGKKGVKVIPNAADDLMASKNSFDLCDEKIEKHIQTFSFQAAENELIEIDQMITSLNLCYTDVVKGHFLFSAAMRFIKIQVKQLGKKAAIPTDMLFSNFIEVFDNTFDDEHPHYSHYKTKIGLVSA